MGKFVKVFISIIFAACLFAVFLGINIVSFGLNAVPKRGDAILILGCRVYGMTPSPFLIERLNEGLKLYEKGYGDYIVVTGGMGPGESITEAEAMKKYLISKGIDENKIIIEDKSTSTMENLRYSKEIMEGRGIKTAVIVSNKYHLKRASLMAKKIGIEASYAGVFLKNYKPYEVSGFLREILALGKFYLLDR